MVVERLGRTLIHYSVYHACATPLYKSIKYLRLANRIVFFITFDIVDNKKGSTREDQKDHL